MPKITIEKETFIDEHNNEVKVLHEIKFQGSLVTFKEQYGIKSLVSKTSKQNSIS